MSDSENGNFEDEFSWVGPGKKEIAPNLSNRKTKTSQRTVQMVLKYEKIKINKKTYSIGDIIAYGRMSNQNVGKIKDMWVDKNQVRKDIIEITKYTQKKMRKRKDISGVPGTGKTATVREVIRCLSQQVEEQKLNDFQFVEINGMKITDPTHSYILLWKALSNSDDKITSKHAAELLESTFSNASSNRLPCVVLMDELDLLVTKKQSVMYNFFDWPNRPYSHLIVVAVANTMDLPERMLTNKVSSRLGLTRINFQPYTHEQLITIVQSRLQGISSFSDDAIQLCARRVSAVSGDARRALDICRQAVEIVERQAKKLKGEKPLVTPAIISQVTKSIFASPVMMIIKRACLHQKIFLISVVNELRRSGIGETSFGNVSNEHLSLCRIYNIERPTISNLSAICSTLGGIKCLIVEGGRADLYGRVRLNVNEEDIIMALKNDPVVGKMIR
ncbi:hypothetical protein PIROE2DRAFT_59514 [Piromyces sp. E2]|nr:hypothetical protein PIROE2DRAFT_59514 [Piromyces sp. E2]|eukprot:OUM66192.1 hypothetical protein PIROE2DRAFT_59514 [Piromyces sp. E2]